MSIIDTIVDKDLRDLIDGVLDRAAAEPEDYAGLWATLRELGLARLTGPAAAGGSEAGWAEAAALAGAAAARGVPAPYVEADLLAGWLADRAGLGSDDRIRTLARIDDTGAAAPVAWGDRAEALVLLGRRDGVWRVAEIAPGAAECTGYPALGREPRCALTVDPALLDAGAKIGEDDVAELQLRGALARCLQTVAALETANALAREYVVTRTQFGRPLAKFQSVQNLIVDAVAEAALARSAADLALAEAIETDLRGPGSAYRVAVAKSVVGRAASTVVRNTHQALGAIGTTGEHSLHRYTNAAMTWRAEFGSIRAWEVALGAAARGTDPETVWDLVVHDGPVGVPPPGK
ncbi:acyl-CoA dehydrogenase family protein [Corynebacterium sphenisci]|uniref:acyl-CoA dehydrogenase family protein n=1 Tax=Corynebacterium sphenisci TaxID=191493 RepID=UPI000951FC97|nr:acyl-CoA dehydrogenase family protein [Corynebacterium sphenisci]